MLFPLSSRRAREEDAAAVDTAVADDGPIFPTKALKKFLTSLTSRESPVLLDLGPVVGSNVTFFGERLGCKIFVEDLFRDVDRHVREGRTEALADFFGRRLTQQDESVDGVLAWNLLDFLDPKAAQALAARLTRILRPDGALLGFFGTLATPDSRFTKYVIVDEENLRQRPYASGGKRRTALQNRDIIRLFDGLRVSESFLLKTNVRETLFRKPRLAAARR